MIANKIKIATTIFLILSYQSQAPCQDALKLSPGRVAADSIDPMQPEAGEFLDENIDMIKTMATDYYNKGDYQKAAQYYLYALKSDIRDGISIYNLACCYALMGHADLAAEYLRRAVRAGFNNYAHLTSDSDFDGVKNQKPFGAVYDSILADAVNPDSGDVFSLYIENSALFKCLVKLPDNYDASRSYPLVIGIHGYGGDADRFIKILDKIEKPEFIYVAPYAPYHFLLNNRIAYSWDLWLPGDQEFPGRDFDITENYIVEVAEYLKSRYRISSTYLLGHSQGASTSYLTGIQHHELFDGIIAIAGSLNTYWLSDSTLNAGNHLKMLIVHGKNDRTFRFVEALSARRLLEKHGYDVTFIEHNGTHALPDDDKMREIVDWIVKSRRQ